jgi:hypothetical protein
MRWHQLEWLWKFLENAKISGALLMAAIKPGAKLASLGL